jgi:hypothetical protein
VQLRLDDLFDRGDWNLVDVVLQLFPTPRTSAAEDPAAVKDLAELDVGGSQLDESPPEREGPIRRLRRGPRRAPGSRKPTNPCCLAKSGQAIPREQANGRGEAG